MYRPRFAEMLDSLKHEYDILLQENTTLKHHIKELEEKGNFHLNEIKKAQAYIKELNSYILNIRRTPALDVKPEQSNLRKIKIGSDWFIEGDEFIEIKLFKSYQMFSPISNVQISPCGRYVAIGIGRTVYYVDVKTGMFSLLSVNKEIIERVNPVNLKNMITAEEGQALISFPKDSAILYTVHSDRVVRKWNILTGKLEENTSGFKDDIVAIKCVDDVLFACTRDMQVRIYNSNGIKNVNIGTGNESKPSCIAIPKKMGHLFCGTTDRKVIVVNLENEERRETIVSNKGVQCIDASDDGKMRAASGPDDSVSMYKINTDTLELEQIYGPLRHRGKILTCKFFSNPRYVLTGGGGSHV
jgi:WD40 repeat protein